MPYDDPDPTDPMTLHAIGLETESEEAMVEMAVCFVQEYARLGFDEARIMRLFHTKGYAGPALALRILGEQRIRELISEEIAFRGPRLNTNQNETTPAAGISLPVLQSGRC